MPSAEAALQPAVDVTQIMCLKDPEKRTPLHAAAFLGDAEIIELLILSGKTFSRFLFLLRVFFK